MNIAPRVILSGLVFAVLAMALITPGVLAHGPVTTKVVVSGGDLTEPVEPPEADMAEFNDNLETILHSPTESPEGKLGDPYILEIFGDDEAMDFAAEYYPSEDTQGYLRIVSVENPQWSALQGEWYLSTQGFDELMLRNGVSASTAQDSSYLGWLLPMTGVALLVLLGLSIMLIVKNREYLKRHKPAKPE